MISENGVVTMHPVEVEQSKLVEKKKETLMYPTMDPIVKLMRYYMMYLSEKSCQ